MADIKISELPTGSASDTDVIPVVDGGATKKISLSALQAYIQSMGDNVKATFGASDDLQIYHDGANSYITDTSTGDLIIDSNGNAIRLKGTNGENMIVADTDASAKLFHNGAEKLATTATGVDVTGNVDLADNGKLLLGNSDDLQIFHDGTNSYIKDSGTGNVNFLVNDLKIRNAAGNQDMLQVIDGADVRLGYAGSTKLATTSTGINVTGSITADGLTVDTTASNGAVVNASDNSTTNYPLKIQNAAASGRLELGTYGINNNIDLKLQRQGSTKLTVNSTGIDVTGTVTADGLVIDGAGTNVATFNGKLGFATDVTIKSPAPNSNMGLIFTEGGTPANKSWKIGSNIAVNGNLEFIQSTTVGGTTFSSPSLSIDTSGNLLVGTTSASNSGKVTIDAGASATGLYAVTDASAGYAASVFERSASDGDITVFKKGGTNVGSIGTGLSSLAIGTGNTQLMFWNAQSGIFPSNGTTVTDNSIDFGNPNYRFKDLYLSGGVYLGGTGAANKLDDYEEGTWTPVLAGASGHALANVYGKYIKVGSLVTLFFKMQVTTAPTSGNNIYVGGLPFDPEGTSNSLYSGIVHSQSAMVTTDDYHFGSYNSSVNMYVYTKANSAKNIYTHWQAGWISGQMTFNVA